MMDREAWRFMGSQRVGHDWATELNWWCNNISTFEDIDRCILLSNILLYICTTSTLPSPLSMDIGCFLCFHVLAVVNSAAVNIAVHVFYFSPNPHFCFFTSRLFLSPFLFQPKYSGFTEWTDTWLYSLDQSLLLATYFHLKSPVVVGGTLGNPCPYPMSLHLLLKHPQ